LEVLAVAYSEEWDDISDYVVHFTKPSNNRDQYDNIMSILWHRVLKAGGPFGFAKSWAPDGNSQRSVCFSEIPLHRLERLADSRGDYGIGFTKRFLIERGGGPVWYVEKDGPAYAALQQLRQRAASKPDDPIWRITPLIDAPGDYPKGKYRFEWEREWRCVGSLRFAVEEVAFLILPEKHHGAAGGFFQSAIMDNFGPGYLCPYLDPRWDLTRVRKALDAGDRHD
jgi:hypothetical protein